MVTKSFATNYPFSHNHGSGKWGPGRWLNRLLSGAIFHFHDYGRKGNDWNSGPQWEVSWKNPHPLMLFSMVTVVPRESIEGGLNLHFRERSRNYSWLMCQLWKIFHKILPVDLGTLPFNEDDSTFFHWRWRHHHRPQLRLGWWCPAVFKQCLWGGQSIRSTSSGFEGFLVGGWCLWDG